MFKWQRFQAVAHKEFIHVFRDWRSLVLAIAIPIFLIFLYGYALTLDLKNVPTLVWDQSETPESREFISLFEGSPYFSILGHTDGYPTIQDELNSGRAMIGLVIPVDFAARLNQNLPIRIQAIVDGSDANTSRLAMSYASAITAAYNINAGVQQLAKVGQTATGQPVNFLPRVWYNADLRSQNAILPGIIAIVLVVIAAMLTSVTIAREWEMGTMEQLISTPIRPSELIFGKIVPYFIIGMIDVLIAVIMSRWIFHVPMRGNPGLLFGMAALFLTGALFLGMTLSIVLKSQVLANQIAIVSGFLPTLILSGFVFAIHNMPTALQYLTYIVSARYFITLIRGIYLKGIGLEIMWVNALMLALYAAILITVSHRKLKLMLE
ncbi:MAG: ABC transporter permease [Desulfatirhabdiaceae bacterium]